MVMAAIGPKTKSGSFRSKKSTKRARKSRSKAKKPMMIQTTHRKLPAVPQVASAGYTFELDKALSQMNHKLYRQGMNYHAKVSVANSQAVVPSRSYSIYTIATDHRTIGALRMARSIYNQAVTDELEIRPEVKSAWTDFKIEAFSNVSGTDVTFAPWKTTARTTFLNTDLGATPLESRGISDAYNPSEITTNAGVQTKFMLAGFGNEGVMSFYYCLQCEKRKILTVTHNRAAEICATCMRRNKE